MFSIKPAAEADSSSIAALIVAIQREEFGIPITLADQPDLLSIASSYSEKGGNFWVARIDERIIGTVALLSIGDGVFALRKMFVHKDFRGAGVGLPGVAQRLLEHALQWASENKGVRVYLGTTEKFVAAQKFYRKNGFVEIECAMLPHSFPVMKVDSRFFFKDLRGAV